ncbi:hypothetical protein [Dokdonia sp.]|uniref:hypothetical protein n=1 Tax=Dokdonia sp. TaxID=2024995 RepID=UPI0032650292
MEELITRRDSLKKKMYKDKAISIGTFIGGPLVGGYLLAENFKAIGQSDKVTKTWIITILATIAIFGLAFLIPENTRFPKILIPAIYTAIASGIFKKYQEPNVLNQLESSGEYYSWGRTIGVSIIGIIITGAILLITAFTIIEIEESNMATKKYGLTVKHEIEYNTSDFTVTEIDQIADGFIEHAFFDLDVAKYVYVNKEEQTYELYMPISEMYADDQGVIKEFTILKKKMDSYITDKKVIMKIVVNDLDNVIQVIE